ncbi:MAG: hypothetical protein XE11_0280 [Methanomicrobiales archaeon 53_19]|jgi:mRNA-degrading endonuclease toxin of MazEF toxin-antitoxin module|nr:MAG: hypothetical protein XD88_0313 [Methanocalculus sp. 52_23]KUL04845.1 MAG: hypothetical protein XE11_0280 [Methanomicrobiales archaeon 53_19]
MTEEERKNMSSYKKRDVVLAPFSFYPGDTAKVRPAIVLSEESGDLLLVPCSRRLPDSPSAITIDLDDFEEGGLELFEESVVLVAHLTKMPRRKIISKKGRLSKEAFGKIVQRG